MSHTRRQFIKGMTALGVSGAFLHRASAASQRAKRARSSPRAFLHIYTRGGIDAILSTDPRTKAEVAPDVDVPYGPEEITVNGNVRTGPLLQPLAPYLGRMAFLNGVACESAGHNDALALHMRRVYPSTGIGLTGTLGALRMEGAICPEIRVAPFPVLGFNAGQGLSLPIGSASRLARLSQLARQSKRGPAVVDGMDAVLDRIGRNKQNAPVEVVRNLIARLAMAPLPATKEVTIPPQKILKDAVKSAQQQWTLAVRDIVYLLENRVTPAIFFVPPFTEFFEFDTHQENLAGQRLAMAVFTAGFAALLKELDDTRDAKGRALTEDVTIMVASELGRFPYLNAYLGKDHFPELPVILMGPGVRPGQYGETNQTMAATPISTQTGRASSSPRDILPTIDDVATTVLRLFGIEDAASVGYLGRPLDFLLA